MDGWSVGDRLKIIKDKMSAAALRAGRSVDSVRLLGVVKKQSLGKIRAAYDAGLRDFAENYVQEAVEKIEQLSELDINWHFIGRIQSNKIRMLSQRFKYIHSVERENVAEALSRLSEEAPQNIFLQYNVAAEISKGGAGEAELERLFEDALNRPGLRMQGLMVMPPLFEDAQLARPYFRQARQMLEKLASNVPLDLKAQHPFDQLSMGTSSDFEVAIEEGASWVRIGSEIFGAREG